MPEVTVRGHSDDIVYIGGDLSEEMYPRTDNGRFFIAFSNGTLLGGTYTDEGKWEFRVSCVSRDESVAAINIDHHEASDGYSDFVKIVSEDEFQWAVIADNTNCVRRPK